MEKIKMILNNEFFKTLITLAVLLLVLLISSCSTGYNLRSDSSSPNISSTEKPASDQGSKLNSGILQRQLELKKISAGADYRIGPEDLLEITVFQVDELKVQVRVSANGYIKLPVIDAV